MRNLLLQALALPQGHLEPLEPRQEAVVGVASRRRHQGARAFLRPQGVVVLVDRPLLGLLPFQGVPSHRPLAVGEVACPVRSAETSSLRVAHIV